MNTPCLMMQAAVISQFHKEMIACCLILQCHMKQALRWGTGPAPSCQHCNKRPYLYFLSFLKSCEIAENCQKKLFSNHKLSQVFQSDTAQQTISDFHSNSSVIHKVKLIRQSTPFLFRKNCLKLHFLHLFLFKNTKPLQQSFLERHIWQFVLKVEHKNGDYKDSLFIEEITYSE